MERMLKEPSLDSLGIKKYEFLCVNAFHLFSIYLKHKESIKIEVEWQFLETTKYHFRLRRFRRMNLMTHYSLEMGILRSFPFTGEFFSNLDMESILI
jgi:hypothetical protein